MMAINIARKNCIFWLFALYLVHSLNCIAPDKFARYADENTLTKLLNTKETIINYTRTNEQKVPNMDLKTTKNLSKLRIKRQSSGGKYTDAAKMPQIKVLRLMLQMLRNTWDSSYVGGVHPMHHEVPKTFVELVQQKITDFFFPKVGGEVEGT